MANQQFSKETRTVVSIRSKIMFEVVVSTSTNTSAGKRASGTGTGEVVAAVCHERSTAEALADILVSATSPQSPNARFNPEPCTDAE